MMLFLLVVILVVAIIAYSYSKSKHSFWAERGVQGPVPLPIVGNFAKVLFLKKHHSKLIQDVYEQYPNEKIVGLYRGFKPVLLIRDPDLINLVMTKDFPAFQDKVKTELPSLSKLNNNLLKASGETWRVLRSKLTPLFSSKKLKDMIPLLQQCADNYINYVEYLTENNIDHEIRDLQSKYTLQVIGLCVFGVHFDTYTNQEDLFSSTAKQIFNPPILLTVLMLLDMIIPGVRKLDKTTEIYNFFKNLVKTVINQRKNEPMRRKDFMDLMIELKEQGKASKNTEKGTSKIEINDEVIAAQAFIFCAAGFETSSGAMSFMIHEMALNQEIQDKVYREICKVTTKHNGKITYEAITEMTYLEQVLYETLRKHSVATKLIRVSQTDYTLPCGELCIPKGTLVYISILGIHSDKKYYRNPEKFDPDNFSPEKKAERPHGTYLAFGEGPRNCIGKRFALILSLMAMAAFLKKFRVEPSAKTKAVLDFKTIGITLESKEGIWVKISKRTPFFK